MGPRIRMLRPFTLLPPTIGMLAGAAAALGALGTESAGGATLPLAVRIAVGAVMAATLNAASNVLNQIHDLDLDRVNKPHRPLPAGELETRQAGWLAFWLYLAANAMAFLVDSGGGRELFVIVLFTSFLTYAYSGPPMRWRRFGWRANLTIAVPRGLLLKVAGWSCVAPVFDDSEPWRLGAVFALFLFGAAATKDFGDMAGDEQGGVRTLPVRLGAARAARLVGPFLAIPWSGFTIGAWLGWFRAPTIAMAVLGVVLFIYGAWVWRRLAADPEQLSEQGENHPAWRHVYLLMMGAQIGSAAVYLAG